MSIFRRRNRRKRHLWQRVATAVRSTGHGTVVLLKVLGVAGLLVAVPVGLYEGYQALMRSDYFMITAVHIRGNERLSRDDVLAIAGLEGRRNIFAVDAARIAERLLDNPWVIETAVELDLPRTVQIDLVEREQAGWLWWDGLYRVDPDGYVIEEGPAHERDGALITGIEPTTRLEAAQDDVADRRRYAAERVGRALDIAHWYRSQGLSRFDELAEIHFDELLGFSLLTRRHGMEARLGHDRLLERLERLRDVLTTLEGQELTGRYLLLDGEGSLTRVAVGPVRPGRGVAGPAGREAPLRQ